MRSLAPVFLLVLVFIGVVDGADSNVESAPRADCGVEAAESCDKEFIGRIATLERKLDEEAKARLAERAAAESSLATARKEMAKRLETMSSALRDAEATRDNAVASEQTPTGGAAEQRASAAQASARADELERGLSDATQRIATLEKDLAASKEAARVADVEAQKARSDSQKEIAALQAAITSKANENALLTKQLDQQNSLQPSAKGADSERGSLVKARAEIDRLNDLNIELQALIDEKSGGEVTGEHLPPRKASLEEERRESETRARNARPLLADRAVRNPSRAGQDSPPDDLAKALGRRDEIQHAIERLKGSPADQAAPAKAVELKADLESVNLEIRRLTVVLGDPDVSSR